MLNTECHYKFTDMITQPVIPTAHKYMKHENNCSGRCRLHNVFFLQYNYIFNMYNIETFKVVLIRGEV